jgi:hypothetical protein
MGHKDWGQIIKIYGQWIPSSKQLPKSHRGTIIAPMRIIALSTLKAFWENDPSYTDVIQPALAWYRHALKADWATPAEVKADFKNASILKDGRVSIQYCR